MVVAGRGEAGVIDEDAEGPGGAGGQGADGQSPGRADGIGIRLAVRPQAELHLELLPGGEREVAGVLDHDRHRPGEPGVFQHGGGQRDVAEHAVEGVEAELEVDHLDDRFIVRFVRLLQRVLRRGDGDDLIGPFEPRRDRNVGEVERAGGGAGGRHVAEEQALVGQ